VIGRVPLRRLEDVDGGGGSALRCHDRPDDDQGAINGEIFLAYVEQCLMPDAQTRRHRRDGITSRHTRSMARRMRIEAGRREPALSATILNRPQSDRVVL